ncbi:MAG: glycine cleavage system aminomethyltransferase GcvT [Gemmatimonadetes bacterium]|nr:glycine cleavage system aminomethyltransferase GcvT [Gemmatimonadota bacterium]
METTAEKKTPLHEQHLAAGGKMVPFAGFTMPIQYPTGIRAEHQAVREGAGMFDVSHMGEFWVAGPDAEAFTQFMTVNDVSVTDVGQAQYSALCNEEGRVLDDLLVYRLDGRFLLVVNASNREKDWNWLQRYADGYDVNLIDASDRTALIALQGPQAQPILGTLTDLDLDAVGYYRFSEGSVAGAQGIISRTGYTGEDGFELYLPAEKAAGVWTSLMEAGRPHGLIPAGLGARDSLRLEMGYALYGNDLDEEHTALESGLGWIVKLDAGEFVGRAALARQKEEGVQVRLTGVRLEERGFPRPGYPLVSEGEDVGAVTSGVLSPSVGCGVALGYLPRELAKSGTPVGVRIRDGVVPGVTQRPPFYGGGSVKR